MEYGAQWLSCSFPSLLLLCLHYSEEWLSVFLHCCFVCATVQNGCQCSYTVVLFALQCRMAVSVPTLLFCLHYSAEWLSVFLHCCYFVCTIVKNGCQCSYTVVLFALQCRMAVSVPTLLFCLHYSAEWLSVFLQCCYFVCTTVQNGCQCSYTVVLFALQCRMAVSVPTVLLLCLHYSAEWLSVFLHCCFVCTTVQNGCQCSYTVVTLFALQCRMTVSVPTLLLLCLHYSAEWLSASLHCCFVCTTVQNGCQCSYTVVLFALQCRMAVSVPTLLFCLHYNAEWLSAFVYCCYFVCTTVQNGCQLSFTVVTLFALQCRMAVSFPTLLLFCLLVGCSASHQGANGSQGRICSGRLHVLPYCDRSCGSNLLSQPAAAY